MHNFAFGVVSFFINNTYTEWNTNQKGSFLVKNNIYTIVLLDSYVTMKENNR